MSTKRSTKLILAILVIVCLVLIVGATATKGLPANVDLEIVYWHESMGQAPKDHTGIEDLLDEGGSNLRPERSAFSGFEDTVKRVYHVALRDKEAGETSQ